MMRIGIAVTRAGILSIALLFFSCPASGTRESITADRLAAHVRFLSSDRLKGRETGSPGIKEAEEYIADSFRKSGLVPAPGTRGFYQDFSLHEYGTDAQASRLSVLVGDNLFQGRIEVDFTPLMQSAPGAAVGEAVFAGYGISAPERGYDDYAGIEARGKIVIAFRHEPERLRAVRPDKKKKYSPYAFYSNKIRTAAQRGAAAVIFVTDPFYPDEEGYDLRALSRLSLRADEPESALFPNDDDSKPGAIPAFLVSKSFGERILKTTGSSPAGIQHALESGKKAKAFAIKDVRALLFSRRSSPPRETKARNAAAFLPGRDPVLRDRWIVVGAHHDHLGDYRGDGDTIYNGADDNASGTSGLLELAAALGRLRPRPRHSLVFIAFSAEEMGLFGSTAVFVRKLLPEKNLAYMVNLDMIGRNPERVLQVLIRGLPAGLERDVGDFFSSKKPETDVLEAPDQDTYSDDFEFARRGLPTFFFFGGLHADYHTVDDEADRLDYPAMEARVRLAYDFILFLDER